MDRFKFLKKIRQGGFTLIEVLVSIGLLSTMVMVVAYMTVSNQNEILRNNAETYADLIASDKFSSLVAYRNQKVFDLDPNTNWSHNLHKDIYFGGIKLYVEQNLTNGKFILTTNTPPPISKILDDKGGHTDLTYFMQFSTMNDPNLIKVYLQVTYTDRGGITRDKDYYTVLGNYLGSQ